MPNAWTIRSGRLVPYEFYFSTLGHDRSFDFDAVSAFLTDFLQLIDGSGLERCNSLRLFPHKGFTSALECTNRRANINLTPNQVRITPYPSPC